MVVPNKERALTPDGARSEVVRDIYEEHKELFGFQGKVKETFEQWIEDNLKGKDKENLMQLIDKFNAVYSDDAHEIVGKLKEYVSQLDKDAQEVFREFVDAFEALVKAFDILKDLEVSEEEVKKELADLKAEIIKPLIVKGKKFEEVISEESKNKLEKIVNTESYKKFFSKFLSLEGVRNFLREEEFSVDFEKNDYYDIRLDSIVRQVVGYLIDLGVIKDPQDLENILDKIEAVGGTFEYKKTGDFIEGLNALLVKAGDKVIAIRGKYGTMDIKFFPDILKKGIAKNLKKAAKKLGVSESKIKELLGFEAPYGKIGEEKLGMEVKKGRVIEGKEFSYEIQVSPQGENFLRNLFTDEKLYNPEQGRYGIFYVKEDGKVFITAPFVKAFYNGKELSRAERMRLHQDGIKDKKITLVVDPEYKNLREIRIEDSKDGQTHVELYTQTREKISYGGSELMRNFDNLPLDVVQFLNEHMQVDEKNQRIIIDGKEIPRGSKVVLFRQGEGISYRLEKSSFDGFVEFEYKEELNVGESDKEGYKVSTNKESLKLPDALRKGIEIKGEKVLIDINSLKSVLGVDISEGKLQGDILIQDGKLVVPHLTGDVRIIRTEKGVSVEYKYGKYPLQLVYIDFGENSLVESNGEVIKKKYEILEPQKIEALEKVKDIGEYVERNKLALAKLNMFDDYYRFVDSYKNQRWDEAAKNLKKMLTSPKVKEFGIEDPSRILPKINSLKGVDLIYALALFVKGTLTDEYLLGENLSGEKVDESTRESIGREVLKIKKEEFLEHIRANWGDDLAKGLEKYVIELNPGKIDVSESNRKVDKSLIVSLVYTKRAKEESFSLIPHGLGDVLEGKKVVVKDVILARKILEKMPQELLQETLKNYGLDDYIDVSSLQKEEVLELFRGKELVKNGNSVKIEGEPVYYLYGECINPTVGYHLKKIVVEKKETKESSVGLSGVNVSAKGYRLLEKGEKRVSGAQEISKGGGYFKGRVEKPSSQLTKVGDVELIKQPPKIEKFNTVDVIAQEGSEWDYAIGEVEYKRNPHEEPPTGPEDPETTPGEGDKPAPNPGDDIDE